MIHDTCYICHSIFNRETVLDVEIPNDTKSREVRVCNDFKCLLEALKGEIIPAPVSFRDAYLGEWYQEGTECVRFVNYDGEDVYCLPTLSSLSCACLADEKEFDIDRETERENARQRADEKERRFQEYKELRRPA